MMNRISVSNDRPVSPGKILFNRDGHPCRVDAETGTKRFQSSLLTGPESQESFGVMDDSILQSVYLLGRQDATCK